jgi:hypothetical protein
LPLAGLPPLLRIGPWTRRVRRARPAPRPPWVAPRVVHCRARCATPARRAVVAPAPHDRLAGVTPPFLPLPPRSPAPGCARSLRRRHGLAAGGDAGRIPALGLRGGWPPGASPNVHPGAPRVAGHRVWTPGLARLPCPSPPAPWCRQHRLPWREHAPLRGADHQRGRIPKPGRGVPPRDGPLAPVLQPSPQGGGGWLGTARAPIASQGRRPGRPPARWGAPLASQAGASAGGTPPCWARSARVGRPPGRGSRGPGVGL